jgi:hypothetical protein
MVNLVALSDSELLRLRASIYAELRRRGLATTVGQMAERLAIEYFNSTAGCPVLAEAAVGTANVDALSRRGDRYSIKGVLDARKTGTIYSDADDPDRQLFEYLLIVILDKDWSLKVIHELTWAQFLQCRSWDKRMNAWYVGLSERVFSISKSYYPPSKCDVVQLKTC